jgi:prepilin-type N-terminal cleavage/methylation domain-containing protein
MKATPGRGRSGMSLLEVMISLLIITAVALANGSVIRAMGVMGVVQWSGARHERPARLRTVAMEYVQAELEYLNNWPYDYFRDPTACSPSNGLPTPFVTARRVPSNYLNAEEPRLPLLIAAADILISTESVINPGMAPVDCRPRRITVNVYMAAGDAPAVPGGSGGIIFVRGETAIAPR